MSGTGFEAYDDDLTDGVPFRRCIAWVLDWILIGLLVAAMAWLILIGGLVTLGAGLSLFVILPLVPFLYQLISLAGAHNATPGQRIMGLIVRRNDDLGPPTGFQALVFVLAYLLTIATSGLLLLVALFTTRQRTLHDMVSGLVVVRLRGLEALTPPPGYWNMNGPSSPYSGPRPGP